MIWRTFLLICCLMLILPANISAQDDNLQVITPENAASLTFIRGLNTGRISDVRRSPDGEIVAVVSAQYGVSLYHSDNLDTPYCFIPSPIEPLSFTLRILFDPSGEFLAVFTGFPYMVRDAQIKIWDVTTCEVRHILPFEGSEDDAIQDIEYSPDGSLIAAGYLRGNIGVWNTATGEIVTQFNVFPIFTGKITFSRDGSMLAAVSDDWDENPVPEVIWNTRNWLLVDLPIQPEAWEFLQQNPDGSLVIIEPVQDESLEEDLDFPSSSGAIGESMAINPDGTTVAISGMQVGIFTDLSHLPMPRINCEAAGGYITDTEFSPTGRTYLTVGISDSNYDGMVNLWDSKTGELISTLVCSTNRDIPQMQDAAYAPNGLTVFTAGSDGFVRMWSTFPPFQEVFTLQNGSEGVLRLAVINHGTRLITVDEAGVFRVWNWFSKTLEHEFQTTASYHIRFVISLDETLMAILVSNREENKEQVELWSLQDYQRINVVAVDDLLYGISSLAFNPDGNILAIADGRGFVALCDVQQNQQLRYFEAHLNVLGYSTSIVFTPDGKQLITAGEDGAIRVWGVPQ